jgi:hypothetical protein
VVIRENADQDELMQIEQLEELCMQADMTEGFMLDSKAMWH